MQKTKYVKRLLTVALVIAGLPGLIELNGAEDHDEIPLVNQSGYSENEGGPRTSDVLIEAYYDTDLTCVCAYLSNAGYSVSVEFVNNTTSETEEYAIPGSGSSIMPISGTVGNWSVTFTLSNGNVYYGVFVL